MGKSGRESVAGPIPSGTNRWDVSDSHSDPPSEWTGKRSRKKVPDVVAYDVASDSTTVNSRDPGLRCSSTWFWGSRDLGDSSSCEVLRDLFHSPSSHPSPTPSIPTYPPLTPFPCPIPWFLRCRGRGPRVPGVGGPVRGPLGRHPSTRRRRPRHGRRDRPCPGRQGPVSVHHGRMGGLRHP